RADHRLSLPRRRPDPLPPELPDEHRARPRERSERRLQQRRLLVPGPAAQAFSAPPQDGRAPATPGCGRPAGRSPGPPAAAHLPLPLQPRPAISVRMIVNEAALQEFKTGLRGELLCPGDDGFDAARKVWNGMIDRTPALIARCAGVADVRRAVA